MAEKINLYDVFAATARRWPKRKACIDLATPAALSYRELLDRIDRAADALVAAGVRPGASIGLNLRSGPEYIVWAYAVWRCRGTIVPIAVELVAEEKQDIHRGIHLDAVIASRREQSPQDFLKPDGETPLPGGAVLLAVRSPCEHPPGFAEINAAFIRFTSGTTDSSKGVVLSHETVFERIHAANDGLRIGPDDTIVWLLSMSYHFTVSIVAYLTFGGTILLCENHFGSTIVRNAFDHGATFIYGSPQHYRMMANDAGTLSLPKLRLAVSTAASLPDETALAFQSRFGVPLGQAYGIIEVGLPCINLDGHPSALGSVGRPLPSYEIRLRGLEEEGDGGSIEVRGRGIADAYYNPWNPRNQFMPDGWFDTGDLGKFDEHGNLFIVGRAKEMISVAGMKLFPQEVERVLESHPIIREARVFACKHDRFGEVPHAEVAAVDGRSDLLSETELREFCMKTLSAFKVPERIRFVEAVERTASGKVLRRGGTAVSPGTQLPHD